MTDILILERARAALQRQHDWHLAQTDEVDLVDGGIIVPADNYSENSMYDQTVAALDALDAEILRRTRP